MAAPAVERLEARISALAGGDVRLERPKDSSHGDFATNVALRTAKEVGRPPRELAEELAARIAGADEIESAEVAGPGFINLRLADGFFIEALSEVGEDYGGGWAASPERIQVEMVSANPTGPIVVSAARNGAYGDCVARLLAFGGDSVEREYYYNDAGAQIERFRASVEALRARRAGAGGRLSRRLRPRARRGRRATRCRSMLASIERTMERFRIRFDSWALQSELEKRLPEFLPRLDTYEAEGALWARSSAYGDEQDWVIDPVSRTRAARRPTARPTSSTSPTSSTAATTRRCTSSAPTTMRPRAGTRRSPGCSAMTPTASRCCSTSSSI